MKKKPETSLQLHYIDKIHTTLVEAGSQIDKVVFAQSLVTLIILALATEIITAGREYSLEGLRLFISPPLILVSGSILIGFLLMCQFGLVKHEEKLRNTILRLYNEIGYSDPSMLDLVANPLESPNLATTILNLYYSRIQKGPNFANKVLLFSSQVFFFILFLFVPLATNIGPTFQRKT